MIDFLELHHGPEPLLLPNAWDIGSARLLASLGFKALATTSSGHAATLGRRDGSVTRDEAIAHARALVDAVEIPVSADLENGFADDPGEVAVTVGMAVDAGLAGCSIEDYSRDPDDPIYDLELATERVAAAAKVAREGGLVLTARAENHLHGRDNLVDTIARLEAYEQAGAHVVYAPGPTDAAQLAAIVKAVSVPVNVLVRGGSPTVAELGELGVARISVGGAFAFAAYGTLIESATELRDQGTYGFTERAAIGLRAFRN